VAEALSILAVSTLVTEIRANINRAIWAPKPFFALALALDAASIVAALVRAGLDLACKASPSWAARADTIFALAVLCTTFFATAVRTFERCFAFTGERLVLTFGFGSAAAMATALVWALRSFASHAGPAWLALAEGGTILTHLALATQRALQHALGNRAVVSFKAVVAKAHALEAFAVVAATVLA
jgi:hypothetical protein